MNKVLTFTIEAYRIMCTYMPTHDIKTIYGTHGEEYLLSVEIDSMNNLDGFLDDAFEGYYDD